jgi:hypothetical protein
MAPLSELDNLGCRPKMIASGSSFGEERRHQKEYRVEGGRSLGL